MHSSSDHDDMVNGAQYDLTDHTSHEPTTEDNPETPIISNNQQGDSVLQGCVPVPVNKEILTNLPSVVCSHIFSFLTWPEKLNLVKAIPAWEEHLKSTDSWSRCDLTLRNPDNLQFIFPTAKTLALETIKKYGAYMPHMCSDIYYVDFSTFGLQLLSYIAKYCTSLRTFRLSHMENFRYGTQQILDRCVQHLNNIARNCRYLRRMAFCFSNYFLLNTDKGFEEVLEKFVGFKDRVSCLSFSTAYNYRDLIDYQVPVADSLVTFHNLCVLKCPIEVLNTEIIQTLAEHSLRDLHVINSHQTQGQHFSEDRHIDWVSLQLQVPKLKVHYTFFHRAIEVSDFKANPMLVSMTFLNLSSKISKAIMKRFISRYKSTLQTFAHILSCEDMDEGHRPAYEELTDVPAMYSELASNCKQLKTLLCAVPIPVEAVVTFAVNCKLKAKDLWVQESKIDWTVRKPLFSPLSSEEEEDENVDEMERLQRRMERNKPYDPTRSINCTQLVGWFEDAVSNIQGLETKVGILLKSNWSACSDKEIDVRIRAVTRV